jgi:cytochrome c
MKNIAILVLAACAALPALADKKLAESKNCLACHAVGEKVLGPALKEIAAKYAGQKDAATMLADKIKKGGVGVWGQVPMPANDVTPEQAKTLADWVLATK